MVRSDEEGFARKWDSEQRLEWTWSDMSIFESVIDKASLYQTAPL
jgi:hypothetical protein